MLPASFAACVPVFIATPTSACASAGASLVPSPVIATSLPLACSSLMSRILVSGVASARKSSTPASLAIAAAVRGLSPVIITVRMPIARKRSKRSAMPVLTTSLRWMIPSRRAPSATASGVPPESPMRLAMRAQIVRDLAALLLDEAHHGVDGALAHGAPARQVDAAHARLRRERDERAAAPVDRRRTHLLGDEGDDRSPLGRLVGQAGQLGGGGQVLDAHVAAAAAARSPCGCRG